MTILPLNFIPEESIISCNNGKFYTPKDCVKMFGDLPIRKITCNHTINGGGLLIIKTECGLTFIITLLRLDVVMYDVLNDLCAKLGKNVNAANLLTAIHTTCKNPFKENFTFGAFGKNFTLKWIVFKGPDGKLAQSVMITLHSDDGTPVSHVLNF